jgi:hypothetical protein
MKFRSQKGQVLVLTAFSMTALLGFMALALDIGLLFRAKRNLQIAADAAATAGALDASHSTTANMNANANIGADLSIALNDEVGLETVNAQVFEPPADGPNAGKVGFVEVILTQTKPTIFMNMFSRSGMAISARAVAGAPSYVNNCGSFMGTKGANLTIQGSGNLDAPNCAFYLNSTDTAINLTGNVSMDASTTFNLYSKNPISTKSKWLGPINYGVPAETPLLPVDTTGPTPANGGCANTDATTSSISGNYPPGSTPAPGSVICFSQAITLKTGANLQGAAGAGVIYVFEKGVSVPVGNTVNVGSATCTSSTGPCTSTSTGDTFSNTLGATMDIEGGAFSMASGQANLSIYSPTAGTYNGVAVFQPYTNPSPLELQFGSNNTYLDGIIFDPAGTVTLHDAGGGVKATGFVLGSLNIATSTLSITNYSASNQYTTPLRDVTLVE